MGQGKDVVDKLLCNACCVDIIDETAKIYLVIRAFVVCDLAQKGVVCSIKNSNRQLMNNVSSIMIAITYLVNSIKITVW